MPHKVLPAEGRQEPVPNLPPRRGGRLPSTREWWNRIWKSPMATEWIDADFDTIPRLALMVDADARGESSVTLRREIRLLGDAFGLNPASRVRLRWQIGTEDGAAIRRRSDVWRLRAVDPDEPADPRTDPRHQAQR